MYIMVGAVLVGKYFMLNLPSDEKTVSSPAHRCLPGLLADQRKHCGHYGPCAPDVFCAEGVPPENQSAGSSG
jgi:hypothetical protein